MDVRVIFILNLSKELPDSFSRRRCLVYLPYILPVSVGKAVVSHKILANLKIDEAESHKTGVSRDGTRDTIDLRVSTLPVVEGREGGFTGTR